MKKLVAGVDLHSNNVVIGIIDQDGKRVAHRKLSCELKEVSGFLAPYKKRLEQVAVESTYNWYWLVDGLRALKYPVVLANPAAMEQYSGIKHAFEPSGVIGGCRAPFNGELLGKTICGGFDRAASQ